MMLHLRAWFSRLWLWLFPAQVALTGIRSFAHRTAIEADLMR
jgi:hypothetical protein